MTAHSLEKNQHATVEAARPASEKTTLRGLGAPFLELVWGGPPHDPASASAPPESGGQAEQGIEAKAESVLYSDIRELSGPARTPWDGNLDIQVTLDLESKPSAASQIEAIGSFFGNATVEPEAPASHQGEACTAALDRSLDATLPSPRRPEPEAREDCEAEPPLLPDSEVRLIEPERHETRRQRRGFSGLPLAAVVVLVAAGSWLLPQRSVYVGEAETASAPATIVQLPAAPAIEPLPPVRPEPRRETELATAPAKPAPQAVRTAPKRNHRRSRPARARRGPRMLAADLAPAAHAAQAPLSANVSHKGPAASAPIASPAEPAQKSTLPALPSRARVHETLRGFRPALESCAGGVPGLAEVELKVTGSGRVAHALVRGNFRGSPQGSCMARALRGLRFPRFADEQLNVSFPYFL